MGRITTIALMFCLAMPAWGQGTLSDLGLCPEFWAGSVPCVEGPVNVQFDPGIPRAEVQELVLAYQEVISRLEAQLREHDFIVRSLQAQLAAQKDYQKALEENNEVLRELAGQGEKKGFWGKVWFVVEVAAPIASVCMGTGVC